MPDPIDPITDADLCAYVDEELDLRRRIQVMDHLSCNPALAASIMAQLRTRDVMRLSKSVERSPRADVLASARRLDRKLSHFPIQQLSRASIAAMVLLGGSLMLDEISEMFAPPASAAVPSFVDEAVDTHNAARLREKMASESRDTVLDQAEIKQAMKITFPKPSQNWRVLDSRVVPSDEGPGLEISLDAGRGKPITFFAVPTKDQAPAVPEAIKIDGASVAYWRTGDIGYALAGEIDLHEMDRLATDFANNPVG